jgi:hypothetical protein
MTIADKIKAPKAPQTATELLQAEVLRVTADNNELRAKLAARDSADAAMTSNDIADRLDVLAAEMRRQPATAPTPASDWAGSITRCRRRRCHWHRYRCHDCRLSP